MCVDGGRSYCQHSTKVSVKAQCGDPMTKTVNTVVAVVYHILQSALEQWSHAE